MMICTDPNCDHDSHGSARVVLDILRQIRERNPEKFQEFLRQRQLKREAEQLESGHD